MALASQKRHVALIKILAVAEVKRNAAMEIAFQSAPAAQINNFVTENVNPRILAVVQCALMERRALPMASAVPKTVEALNQKYVGASQRGKCAVAMAKPTPLKPDVRVRPQFWEARTVLKWVRSVVTVLVSTLIHAVVLKETNNAVTIRVQAMKQTLGVARRICALQAATAVLSLGKPAARAPTSALMKTHVVLERVLELTSVAVGPALDKMSAAAWEMHAVIQRTHVVATLTLAATRNAPTKLLSRVIPI